MRFIINLLFFNGLFGGVRQLWDYVIGDAGGALAALTPYQKVLGVISGDASTQAQDILADAIGLQTTLHPALPAGNEFSSFFEAFQDADINPQSLAGLLDISDPGGVQINGVIMQFRNAADGLGYPGDSGTDRLADVMIWVAGNAQPPA